jgi:hypothetical protein
MRTAAVALNILATAFRHILLHAVNPRVGKLRDIEARGLLGLAVEP